MNFKKFIIFLFVTFLGCQNLKAIKPSYISAACTAISLIAWNSYRCKEGQACSLADKSIADKSLYSAIGFGALSVLLALRK